MGLARSEMLAHNYRGFIRLDGSSYKDWKWLRSWSEGSSYKDGTGLRP